MRRRAGGLRTLPDTPAIELAVKQRQLHAGSIGQAAGDDAADRAEGAIKAALGLSALGHAVRLGQEPAPLVAKAAGLGYDGTRPDGRTGRADALRRSKLLSTVIRRQILTGAVRKAAGLGGQGVTPQDVPAPRGVPPKEAQFPRVSRMQEPSLKQQAPKTVQVVAEHNVPAPWDVPP